MSATPLILTVSLIFIVIFVIIFLVKWIREGGEITPLSDKEKYKIERRMHRANKTKTVSKSEPSSSDEDDEVDLSEHSTK